jgi:glucose/mannose-6-phosphate isomerase
MKNLIEAFPAQLEEAVEIAKNAILRKSQHPVANVLISGLGGSGIGGTIAAEMTALESPVPVTVSKGYFIPAWVSNNSLVIISSYSGNTEETLNAMTIAGKRGATIVCITSGGKVAELAKKNNYDLILVPGGNPPRACLGYSLIQLLRVFHFHGFISNDPLPAVLSAANKIKAGKEKIISEASRIADFFKGKMPVLYSTTYREGIAIRWRQQINENSKMLCWHHVVPEMNHNELVGWRQHNDKLAVLFLREKDDYDRNQKRIGINKELIAKYTPNITETWAEGDNMIEKNIWQIHLGDWVSWFLSEVNEVDATEVRVIDYLKNELSKS